MTGCIKEIYVKTVLNDFINITDIFISIIFMMLHYVILWFSILLKHCFILFYFHGHDNLKLLQKPKNMKKNL